MPYKVPTLSVVGMSVCLILCAILSIILWFSRTNAIVSTERVFVGTAGPEIRSFSIDVPVESGAGGSLSEMEKAISEAAKEWSPEIMVVGWPDWVDSPKDRTTLGQITRELRVEFWPGRTVPLKQINAFKKAVSRNVREFAEKEFPKHIIIDCRLVDNEDSVVAEVSRVGGGPLAKVVWVRSELRVWPEESKHIVVFQCRVDWTSTEPPKEIQRVEIPKGSFVLPVEHSVRYVVVLEECPCPGQWARSGYLGVKEG